MVKANAYGHGLEAVARAIEESADYLGVALTVEGISLRKAGIRKPIVVTGGILPEELPACLDYDLIATASTADFLSKAEDAASAGKTRLKVHLKIDTGMERLGSREYEAEPFLEASLRLRQLRLRDLHARPMPRSPAGVLQLAAERFATVLDLPRRSLSAAPACVQLRRHITFQRPTDMVGPPAQRAPAR
jgi:alanine racemase